MGFNSYEFLLFLPISLLVYFQLERVKGNLHKYFLLSVCVFFYLYGSTHISYVMFIDCLINYIFLWLLHKKSNKKILFLGVIFNVILLFYFKYTNFLIDSINPLLNEKIIHLNIIMPLGISFITFQNIATLVDKYRTHEEMYSFVDYSIYFLYFPKVIQGPIVSANQFIKYLNITENRHFNIYNINRGLYRFTLGLGKKVIIANLLAPFVDYGYGILENLTTLETLFIILSYTLQLYFDFSGYSDMAIGISQMFNIQLPENFNSPYQATSIRDFWHRWHITLSSFLTKYVYFSLGGSRQGTFRTYVNILIVFVISGFWHGASYIFILWGLLHGILMCIERFFNIKKVPVLVARIWTFTLVNFTWIFFRATSISDITTLFKRLFSMTFYSSNPLLYQNFKIVMLEYLLKYCGYINIVNANYSLIVIVTLIFLSVCILFGKNSKMKAEAFKCNILHILYIVSILVYSILNFNGVSQFLYTNF